ncbi:MAG TPA: hypothetical protein VHL14_07545 [Steroidobacteraceae bacterium]|jgi:hypothetical protein|nr:hypothetical protein [Steroidobacteraceae bacterium]
MTSAARTLVAATPHDTPPASAWRNLLWAMPLLTATVFSKIAVPPFGSRGIGIALPILLVVMIAGCITCQFVIETRRFAFGLLTIGLLTLVQLLKNDMFYSSSILLLAALHLPLLLQFRVGSADINKVVKFFNVLCSLCALLAIVQFVLQHFISSPWLFPIESFIPDGFRIQNFNQEAPLEYESAVMRANGVFMLEPSYLSQLLAVALVLEVSTLNRVWRIMLYITGMLVSYSGTGFMVLGIALPVVIVAQNRWGLLFGMIIAAIVAVILVQFAGEYLYLDKFISRIGEFNSTGSSGFARFVGGFYLFNQFLSDHPIRALFGAGAGMFKEYAPLAHYPVAEMPLFKMVLEFGIAGALLYFSFLFYCLSSSALPSAVALAVALTFLLNGLYVPFSHALSLSLLVWTSRPKSFATQNKVISTNAAPAAIPHDPLESLLTLREAR